MVKILSFLNFLLLISTILNFSCSSLKTKEDQEILRSAVIKGEYQKELEILEKLKTYKKENSKLLYYLEKGLSYHLLENYPESLLALERAREIYRALYTESISKKAQTLLLNDTFDHYYGETYERSLIHYYLSLNHLLLFQEQLELSGSTAETRKKLFSSRAEILSWDNFLAEQIEEKKGEAIFKNDLLAKIYGGLIHEMVSSNEDNQIALQLYKDAKTLIFRNYNLYPSFNKRYQEFYRNFSKLHEIPENEVREKYVEPTIFQNELSDFLDYKIIYLTKLIRPKDLASTTKIFKIKKETLKKVKRNPLNFSIVLERGIIPEKKAKTKYFPFGTYLYGMPNDKTSIDVNNYGSGNIYSYAINNLGFKSMPVDYNYNNEFGYSKDATYNLATDLAISFEIPDISNPPIKEKVELIIYDNNGNEIKSENFLLVSPIGDMAENAMKERESGQNFRRGLRLVSKYLAAIVASYVTYNSLKNSMSPGLASFLAISEYYIASKIINDLEKADLRYWATLPQNIFIANFFLSPGEYRFKAQISDMDSGSKVQYVLGKVKIDNLLTKKLVKFRLLK